MRRQNRMSLRRFLISSIIMILVPTILLTVFVQTLFIDKLYEQTENDLREKLALMKQELDVKHQNFSDISDYLYLDPELIVPELEYDYFAYVKFRSRMRLITGSNNLISNCVVYFPSHEYLFSTQSTYQVRNFLLCYPLDDFDEHTFLYHLQSLKTKDILYGRISGSTSRYAMHLHPIFDGKGRHLYTIMYIIDEVSYWDTFKQALGSNTGCAYITDLEGNVISYINTDKNRDVKFYSDKEIKSPFLTSETYEDAFVTTVRSDIADIYYTLAVRQSSVFDSTFQLRFLWAGVISVILLVSIILAILFGRANYKPILELKNRASQLYDSSPTSKTDDFYYLSGAFDYLSSRNDLLQNNLDEINDYIVFKLLSGKYSSDKELSYITHLLGINSDAVMYQVVILKDMPKRGYREVYRACLKRIPSNVHFHIRPGTNDGHYIVVLIYDLTSVKGATAVPDFGEDYSVSSGSFQSNIRWIALSYGEAYLNTIANNAHALQFSSCILSDNNEGARFHLTSCIEEMDNMAIEEAALACLRIILSISDACGMYLPQTNILSLPDVFTLMSFGSAERFRELLTDSIAPLLERLATREAQSYQDSNIDMLRYIKDNYRNTDFSFQSMADFFGVSLTVLSRRFSDINGISLTDYATDLKMDMAIELLCTTDMSINEIGLEVGYYSANSFIRRFKQKAGVSPGEYRKQHKA